MAYGTEIMIGWMQPAFRELGDLGLRLPVSEEEWEQAGADGYDDYVFGRGDRARIERVNELLLEAQKGALRKSGLQYLREVESYGRGSSVYKIPEGSEKKPVRFRGRADLPDDEVEVSHLRLSFRLDKDEMGEEEGDASVGIMVLTRYLPTYLDWAHPNGGSGSKLSYDSRNSQMITALMGEISARLPVFGSAELIFMMSHF